LVGSSSRRIDGFCNRSRASATRRRSPPESRSTTLVAGRTTQGVHRHLDLRRHVPRAERIDLLLQVALLRHDGVFRRLVGGVVEFVPRRVVRGGEVGEVLDAFLDGGTHGGAGSEVRFLLKEADGVARFKMHAAVDLPVAAGEDLQERRFAGAVEAEHADFRAVEKRKRDVAEDFLALDLLRDAEHREDYGGSFVGLGHGRH
jgi:hypothetical protein